jgi:hypothetical protein
MRITTPIPSTQTAGNLFAPLVKWITLAGMAAVHSTVHRAARADFNVRAGQGRTGVILRRRPCFFAGWIGRETSAHPLICLKPRTLVICVSRDCLLNAHSSKSR